MVAPIQRLDVENAKVWVGKFSIAVAATKFWVGENTKCFVARDYEVVTYELEIEMDCQFAFMCEKLKSYEPKSTIVLTT